MRTGWTESESEAELSSNQKLITRPFQTYSKKKMTALKEKLAEAVRQFPVLNDKSCRDFKDNSKKRLAWEDVAKQIKLQTGMYCSSEYSFICLVFSFVRIMLLYGYSFLGVFSFGYYLPLLRGYLRKQKHSYVWSASTQLLPAKRAFRHVLRSPWNLSKRPFGGTLWCGGL